LAASWSESFQAIERGVSLYFRFIVRAGPAVFRARRMTSPSRMRRTTVVSPYNAFMLRVIRMKKRKLRLTVAFLFV